MSKLVRGRVTIAIPTRNRVDYLRLALDSALRQSYDNLEVIVSDNYSDDGTADYLRSLSDARLTVLEQSTNLGMIGNWDACLDRATGKYFLLLSDDDLLERDAIRRLVSAIEEADDPEGVAFSYCRCWVIDKNGDPISLDPVAPRIESAEDFVLGYFAKKREYHPCGNLLRTADIRLAGGYRQAGVQLAVDAMVWSRVLVGRRSVAFVEGPSAKYRAYSGNLTSTSRVQVWQNDIRILSKYWIANFDKAPRRSQDLLQRAVRGFEAWMIAAAINQSSHSFLDRLRSLKTYFGCRSSFVGLQGFGNLALGLFKLFLPLCIKKPVRVFLMRAQCRDDKQNDFGGVPG